MTGGTVVTSWWKRWRKATTANESSSPVSTTGRSAPAVACPPSEGRLAWTTATDGLVPRPRREKIAPASPQTTIAVPSLATATSGRLVPAPESSGVEASGGGGRRGQAPV